MPTERRAFTLTIEKVAPVRRNITVIATSLEAMIAIAADRYAKAPSNGWILDDVDPETPIERWTVTTSGSSEPLASGTTFPPPSIGAVESEPDDVADETAEGDSDS